MKIEITKSFQKDETHKVLFSIGVLVFILSNAYFGWNKTAQSGAERVWDVVWQILIVVGGVGMMVQSMVREAVLNFDISVKAEKEDHETK